MDRVSQSFIRRTRFWTICFSIIVAFVFHIDVFSLFEQISTDAELRASLVASSNVILNKADEVIGKSSIVPGVYSESILQLKLRDTTRIADLLGAPPAFKSREEGENWIREQLGGNNRTDSLINYYKAIIDTNLSNSIEEIKDHVFSIKYELEKTKLQLIPQPFPNWDYFPINKNFLGILVMAAFLSLGAPFWFRTLKIMSTLRPILAEKENKEKKESEEK
jgi:hypothetical protein